ncbi:imidazolonepropionase [Anaerobranca gottschalkii]|uniref:Imidazolonepropionase n=1 Tax=Anaerobranca gottschalkii DSM 13577 TaxID=1120990 RepID=A0A1I0AXU8_9FIRM|nr:imidazolonepropionase [Anaerobranca gottschalkii]SES98839.1 imidazolonepropionase [Anaerobranca gottschalkii DSM 13577]
MKLAFVNGNIATFQGYTLSPQRGENFGDLGLIKGGTILVQNGYIKEVGKDLPIPPDYQIIDVQGRLITPGLIDSHTHLVHYGSREGEYIWRIQGKPYMEILKEGGGILSSVRQTQKASLEDLLKQSRKSLDRMLSMGITTVENKSGYGLNLETELKQLKAGQILNSQHPVDVVNTFLGAHAIPLEYKENPDGYVEEVIKMLPIVKEYAEFCDVFCEEGVFSVAQSEKILLKAKEYGFKLKIHADEIVSTKGAQLAARIGCVSADHLLAIDEEGIEELAKSKTIAVLLPGTSFNLMSKKYAPAQKMINKGVAIALATDYNPGSCPTENPQLIMTLACLNLKLTPAQTLAAFTINAAHSLDLAHDRGSIEKGKIADLVIFDCDNVDYIPYHFGINHVQAVYKRGIKVV